MIKTNVPLSPLCRNSTIKYFKDMVQISIYRNVYGTCLRKCNITSSFPAACLRLKKG